MNETNQGEVQEVAVDAQQPEGDTPSPAPEDKSQAFSDLIRGEYKDCYAKEVQRILDRRFREQKTKDSKSQPILNRLMERYGVADLDQLGHAVEQDSSFDQQAATKAGLSVEQYQELKTLQRENANLKEIHGRQAAKSQLQQWQQDGAKVSQIYPEFQLAQEVQNPQFRSLLKAGIPLQQAYEVLHIADIKANMAGKIQQNVVENIRLKGSRPMENGTAKGSGFLMDGNPMTRRQRADIAQRVSRGETIHF